MIIHSMRSEIDDNENIIYVVRKHWIVLFKAVICVVLGVGFRLLPVTSEFVSLSVSLGLTLLGIYFYYDWDFDIWVITNLRVIDEWGVFSSNTRETPLSIIQNVDYHQSIIGQMMGYGDVEICSAAIEGKTVNKFVNEPKVLKDIIMTNKKSTSVTEDERECPDCAEKIKIKAVKCRFCGRRFDDESKANV